MMADDGPMAAWMIPTIAEQREVFGMLRAAWLAPYRSRTCPIAVYAQTRPSAVV